MLGTARAELRGQPSALLVLVVMLEGSARPSVSPHIRPIDLSNGYERCCSALMVHCALLVSGKTLVELRIKTLREASLSSLELVTRAHLHKLPFISTTHTHVATYGKHT
ncbi:hypothetical protein PAMP_004494 [Pampus punctatissimus]